MKWTNRLLQTKHALFINTDFSDNLERNVAFIDKLMEGTFKVIYHRLKSNYHTSVGWKRFLVELGEEVLQFFAEII